MHATYCFFSDVLLPVSTPFFLFTSGLNLDERLLPINNLAGLSFVVY